MNNPSTLVQAYHVKYLAQIFIVEYRVGPLLADVAYAIESLSNGEVSDVAQRLSSHGVPVYRTSSPVSVTTSNSTDGPSILTVPSLTDSMRADRT